MKKILCIHGIGGKDATMEIWSKEWETEIRESSGFTEDLQFQFLKIDDLFTESKKRLGIHYFKAVYLFIASWVSTIIDNKVRSRGISDIDWYAGMPAQFVTDEILRKNLNDRLLSAIQDFEPDVVFSHSLGTLVCYNLFRQEAVLEKSRALVFITAGSQIGHPAMRQLFGGAILPLKVKFWVNFHNEHDRVFASKSIVISSDLFAEVQTPFEWESINHEAKGYIYHQNAQNQGWPIVVAQSQANVSRNFKRNQLGIRNIEKQPAGRKPNRKALLIGINDYPDPQNRLYGCVNDVFRISEVLQEYGFSPDEIRVALNERATAADIRSRLKWLLSDAIEGDLRFFFYSGHGAQIPSPHADYEVDANDECLVPYDFDWTIEHAYTDKEFLELYSQLSLKVNFISVFDCCHSGGITRGSNKAKGLTPPDDIRHREIRWDSKREMWVPRKLKLSDTKYFKRKSDDKALYIGEDGRTNKLGRAFPLWTDIKDQERARKLYGATGAFMPVLLEACGENELAYEYKHGVTSFGAFTYSLTTILRQERAKGNPITFQDLISKTSMRLKELEYDQAPVLVGPDAKTSAEVPFPRP